MENKIQFKSTEKDHYGMDIVPCHIIELEENGKGEIFARFEIIYIMEEEGKEKEKRFHAWGKLKHYDAFFVLQEFGQRHDLKLQVLNKLKPTIMNYKLACKAAQFFNKECNCGIYLKHVMYKNDMFWEPFREKINFSKVPTEALLNFIKNEC